MTKKQKNSKATDPTPITFPGSPRVVVSIATTEELAEIMAEMAKRKQRRQQRQAREAQNIPPKGRKKG